MGILGILPVSHAQMVAEGYTGRGAGSIPHLRVRRQNKTSLEWLLMLVQDMEHLPRITSFLTDILLRLPRNFEPCHVT